MIEKPNSNLALGLEKNSNLLKAAILSSSKGTVKLCELIEIELNQEEKVETILKQIKNVKPLYINNEEKKSLHLKNLDFNETLNKCLVSTALEGKEVLIRSIEIKLKKEKDILAALPFQVEPILPFPLDECFIDKITSESKEDGTTLTLFAAKKNQIKNHLLSWKNLEIEPELISSEALALTHFSNHFIQDIKDYFILNIKETFVSLSLVKNQKLIASQTALIDPNDSENEKTSNEIFRLFYALGKQIKGQEIDHLIFFGEEKISEDFLKNLLSKIKKSTPLMIKDPNFNVDEITLKKFAIPIGLGLQTLPKQKDSINFRQEELSYPDPWKHLKLPFAYFSILSLTIAIAFYLFGQAYLGFYEDKIKEQYVELLSSMNKPYQIFENEYLAKFPQSNLENQEIPTLKSLTQEDLQNRLNYLYKELKASPDMFPLFPNVPRVSDVLAWLSTHPNIIELNANGETKTGLLELDSFSYSMLKRPDLAKKQEKYQVKVDLEFSTNIPRFAREFHDALIAPNTIVDPKGEIKWSSNRGKYKTSFFLKDKTNYPSQRS